MRAAARPLGRVAPPDHVTVGAETLAVWASVRSTSVKVRMVEPASAVVEPVAALVSTRLIEPPEPPPGAPILMLSKKTSGMLVLKKTCTSSIVDQPLSRTTVW